jgi:hypothetical protein
MGYCPSRPNAKRLRDLARFSFVAKNNSIYQPLRKAALPTISAHYAGGTDYG